MLYGAIIGDICGSVYEGWPHQKNVKLFRNGCTFTDDTVCTCAIAKALLTDGDYAKSLRNICGLYPQRGYGPSFAAWFKDPEADAYNSFGNGAIMRVSPVAWVFDDPTKIRIEAMKSAAPSHNHPEGFKGAEAIARAIFMARKGGDKKDILDCLELDYGYPLLDEETILFENDFVPTCQQSIPVVMTAFNEGNNFEECITKAISYGWDTDTNAAVVGSIAEAYYGIDDEMIRKAKTYLTPDLLQIVSDFESKFFPEGNF